MPEKKTSQHGASVTITLCGFLAAGGLIVWQLRNIPALNNPTSLSVYDILQKNFGLSAAGLRTGEWWQLLSYAFLHGSIWHLVANIVGLYISAASLEQRIGKWALLCLLGLGTLAGAVGFLSSLSLDPRLPSTALCLGASASVMACLGTAACFAPHERAAFWFFFIPLPIRAWWALPITLTIIFCEGYFWPNTTAYGAHFGGFLAGVTNGWIMHNYLPTRSASANNHFCSNTPKTEATPYGKPKSI